MDQRDRIAALFDRLSDTYDDVGVPFFGPIAEGLLAEVAPAPGERALDVGCGRGAVLLPLAAAVGPSGRAVGVDLAPRMVASAVERAAEAGLTVEVEVGDAEAPPFPPASFDVVTSSLVLFFLPDPLAALRAWRGLLVEGGRVAVSTFGPYSERWREVDEVFKEFTTIPVPDARTTGAAGPFTSDAGMEQLLADAGFGDVRTATMTLPVRFDDEDHWYRWSWSVGQRQLWESVPTERRRALRVAAYERLDRARDAAGHIGFEQQVRFTLGRATASPGA